MDPQVKVIKEFSGTMKTLVATSAVISKPNKMRIKKKRPEPKPEPRYLQLASRETQLVGGNGSETSLIQHCETPAKPFIEKHIEKPTTIDRAVQHQNSDNHPINEINFHPTINANTNPSPQPRVQETKQCLPAPVAAQAPIVIQSPPINITQSPTIAPKQSQQQPIDKQPKIIRESPSPPYNDQFMWNTILPHLSNLAKRQQRRRKVHTPTESSSETYYSRQIKQKKKPKWIQNYIWNGLEPLREQMREQSRDGSQVRPENKPINIRIAASPKNTVSSPGGQQTITLPPPPPGYESRPIAYPPATDGQYYTTRQDKPYVKKRRYMPSRTKRSPPRIKIATHHPKSKQKRKRQKNSKLGKMYPISDVGLYERLIDVGHPEPGKMPDQRARSTDLYDDGDNGENPFADGEPGDDEDENFDGEDMAETFVQDEDVPEQIDEGAESLPDPMSGIILKSLSLTLYLALVGTHVIIIF